MNSAHFYCELKCFRASLQSNKELFMNDISYTVSDSNKGRGKERGVITEREIQRVR